MLLAARDQENAVLHAPTQNGKQQKLQQFPKTPGVKKLHHQNENLGTIKKGGKSAFAPNFDAFVTPAGPRQRVPLGGKDTNFKTRRNSPEEGGVALKKQAITPGPNKQGSGKASRSVKQLTTTDAKPAVRPSDEYDYPEIEYMPPKPIDLPDIPDDFAPVNLDFVRANMYKNIYRDEFDSYAKMVQVARDSTEDDERMLAESEADAWRILKREEMYDAKSRTLGKKVKPKKANAVLADKKNNVPRAALKPKNLQAKATTTNAVGSKEKQMPLHGKTYSTSGIPSLHRRLPSRPDSTQAVKAAGMLSQHVPAATAKPKAPAAATNHARSKSSASMLSKVSGGIVGRTSRPNSVASTRPKVDPRVAEMKSKSSIGYSAGKPLAASVKRALAKGKEDFDFSSSEEEDDEPKTKQQYVDDDFQDLFDAAGININRIEEEDEDFELVL